MYRAKGFLATVFCALGLTSCGVIHQMIAPGDFSKPPPSAQPSEPESFKPDKACGGQFTQEQRLYLSLIHKMVEQQQFYGALANLDQLEKNAGPSPQTIYLRAEALRGAGQVGAAEKHYRLLLDGCMAGYGLHGLGLLATEAGQLAQAEDYLTRACRERPVDANAHNDLGMVLLLGGKHPDARQEFMTAMELDRNNRLPVENLIVLMLAEKQDALVKQLAAERGLNAQDIDRLTRRARQLTNPESSENPTDEKPSE